MGERWAGEGDYQSMDCGGSSFELEVLTVSTQPVERKAGSQYILCLSHPAGRAGTLWRGRVFEDVDEPGIGSFPCLFKNAEYALMNF